MTELEVLRAARKHFAREGYGAPGTAEGIGVCLGQVVWRACRCTAGRVCKCSLDATRHLVCELGHSEGSFVRLYQFHDSHSYAENLAFLDATIAKLEEQSYGAELPSLPATTKEKVMV